jgi:hypothetical protein
MCLRAAFYLQFCTALLIQSPFSIHVLASWELARMRPIYTVLLDFEMLPNYANSMSIVIQRNKDTEQFQYYISTISATSRTTYRSMQKKKRKMEQEKKIKLDKRIDAVDA